MELSYVRNFNSILLWMALLAIVLVANALPTEHEFDESLNSHLNDGSDDDEFDTSNNPALYGLRINPKYYGLIHHLNKRLKGSEFLVDESESDIYGSQNSKRLSEFLGGPGKRLSEFLGGPGKRKMGGTITPSYFLAKKLSEYLTSSFQRPVRLSSGFFDISNPRGSEFLGGPGK